MPALDSKIHREVHEETQRFFLLRVTLCGEILYKNPRHPSESWNPENPDAGANGNILDCRVAIASRNDVGSGFRRDQYPLYHQPV